MDEIEAMMADLHKRFGSEGMQAIATLMFGLGSDTLVTFSDGTWVPCDILMQIAWANGGEPPKADGGAQP